jgi:nitroreductase
MSLIDVAAFPHGASLANAALFKRYREALPAAERHWNETIGLMLDHRSVRSFLADPLPAGTVEALVAAAQSAPTSSNVQAWSVVAVEDPERRARLAELAGGQQHIVDAPLLLVWVADLARASAIAAERGVALEGADFTESFLIATIDAALAAQNALVAAESLGLGTVYIGAMRNHPQDVARELALPERSYAVVGLVVGRPDPNVETAVKPRLPQDAVLHREQYSLERQAAAIEKHDADARAFREEQGLSPQGWSELVVARLRSAASLSGRHVLRDVLNRLGFKLK